MSRCPGLFEIPRQRPGYGEIRLSCIGSAPRHESSSSPLYCVRTYIANIISIRPGCHHHSNDLYNLYTPNSPSDPIRRISRNCSRAASRSSTVSSARTSESGWSPADQSAVRILPVACCHDRLRLAKNSPATTNTPTRAHNSGS